eukprot:3932912-Rhodomonas_salina.2
MSTMTPSTERSTGSRIGCSGPASAHPFRTPPKLRFKSPHQDGIVTGHRTSSHNSDVSEHQHVRVRA